MVKSINKEYIDICFETNSNDSEWFGYYNYDVLSRDQTKMLCNRVQFDGRSIHDDDTIDLGWYDINTGVWNYIGTTDSFNWQQGAMLQWLPGIGNDNQVIYNLSDKKHYKSVIVDITTQERRYIDFPIYCITPDGRYSISLNYERSYWCRAYHYQPIKNSEYDVNISEDDGIFQVDLVNNTVKRIIRIQDVINLDPDTDFKSAKHWLEHIMLNKNGTKIAFLHRYTYGQGYGTRVCIADIDGNNIQILKNWRTKDWSHLGWKDDNSFVIYTVTKNALQAAYAKQVQKDSGQKKGIVKHIKITVRKMIPEILKRKLRKNEKRYELYQIKDGVCTLSDLYEGDLLDIDGHPSFTNDGKYMITDSYPDKAGNQRLIIMNTINKKRIQIASFGAPFSGNPASCDLHPKLSTNNDYLAIDTAYSGKHKMILFRINWHSVKQIIG